MLRRWLGDRHNPYADLSVEELYASLARTKLRRRPGERVKYSNLGAGLLGEAMARAAGQPYETLVRQRICLPLGMPGTIITPSDQQRTRLGSGRTRRGRPVAPFQLPALVGAGALRSTAADLLCLLRATLDPARTPLAAELERTQLPRLRVAKHLEVGLGCMIARPGSLARCCGTTAGPAAFAASWAPLGRSAPPWSCSATPPARSTGSACGSSRHCLAQPANGARLLSEEIGFRRRRGLARCSAPCAGRSRGPG
jgi:CubicO group peptidase (beta-lactamase class C family)